jgi:hypothetical protein
VTGIILVAATLGQLPAALPAERSPALHSYDRAPAYLATPYPVYHRDYYLPTQYHAGYNPAYVVPPSDLPQFSAHTGDWHPSKSLWYSGRAVPHYYGYWYYPRYVPVNGATAIDPMLVPETGTPMLNTGTGTPEGAINLEPSSASAETRDASPVRRAKWTLRR